MSHLLRFYPLVLLFALGVLVVHLKRSRERTGRLLLLAFAALFLVSWPPTAWLALGTLEWRYERTAHPDRDAGAIVVLSAAAYPPRPDRPYALLGPKTYRRVRHAAWLYEAWKQVPILCCGGAGRTRHGEVVFSDVMKAELVRLGVPEDRILVERRSRSTYENALFGAAILKERGIRSIALVTEAYHMPRAEACFEAQGLEVVPAPMGFRAEALAESAADFIPGHDAIADLELAFHEWLGYLWYLLRGRI